MAFQNRNRTLSFIYQLSRSYIETKRAYCKEQVNKSVFIWTKVEINLVKTITFMQRYHTKYQNTIVEDI
jgi:hypothetical protein